jgi:hypothetical protein
MLLAALAGFAPNTALAQVRAQPPCTEPDQNGGDEDRSMAYQGESKRDADQAYTEGRFQYALAAYETLGKYVDRCINATSRLAGKPEERRQLEQQVAGMDYFFAAYAALRLGDRRSRCRLALHAWALFTQAGVKPGGIQVDTLRGC